MSVLALTTVPDVAPAVDNRTAPRLVPLPQNGTVPARLEIEGGLPLRGTVDIFGAKNEVLPVICAALLTREPVTLHNVPSILDVEVLLQILSSLGARCERLADDGVRITAGSSLHHQVADTLGRKLRASVLLAGPLLARTGRASIPLPGGDAIGRRRLDTHVSGLTSLGAQVETHDRLELTVAQLVGADILLDEPSVTGTENLLMAAVLARGATIIRNAASEPHVQGLCRMLNAMGARIKGIGTGTLMIDGVDALSGCDHVIGPDALEVGTFAAAAAMTGGDVTMRNVRPSELRMIRLVLNRLGVELELSGMEARVRMNGKPRIRSDLFDTTPRIDDGPWPAFPTDLMSVTLALATQCEGTVLFFEKMYEGRLFFTEHLAALGASIVLCDPHRVVVNGPSRLRPGTMRCLDVRAGMAMVLAALTAPGKSTLLDIHHVDRGYARLEERLTGLGARISRTS